MLPHDMETIVIPAKGLLNSKRRLVSAIGQQDVVVLVRMMLEAVLAATNGWESRFLVTNDPETELIALDSGCKVLREEGTGLNDAVKLGLEAAQSEGATVALVLPSDLPLVTATDISNLFASGADVTVVPAEDGGTNALRLRPPLAVEPEFGEGSAVRHLRSGKEAGLRVATLSNPRLALDIDNLADLEALARIDGESKAAAMARMLLSRS